MSAYGYDSRRRRRERRAAQWAADRRRFRRWWYGLLIVALVGLAIFAVVDDRVSSHRDDPTVIWTDESPNPATVAGHP